VEHVSTVRRKPSAAPHAGAGGAKSSVGVAPLRAAAPAWVSSRTVTPFGFGAVVQCAVIIGPVNDRYEREADQVATTVAGGQSHPAERISRLPESGEEKTRRASEPDKKDESRSVQRAAQGEIEEERIPIQGPAAGQIRDAKPLVQRMCSECGHETGASDHPASAVQRLCKECEDRIGTSPGPAASLQRKDEEQKTEKAVQKSGHHASSSAGMQAAAARAISSKGPGSPLPPSVRGTMESRLGANFGGVRVHTDGAAQDAAAELHARAFTNRSDIWLGRGQSPTNLSLMAHELTHVVQQSAVPARGSSHPGVQRASEKSDESSVQRAAEEKKSDNPVQRAMSEEKKSEPAVQRAEAIEHQEEKPVQRGTIGEGKEPQPVQRTSSEGSKEEGKIQRAAAFPGGLVQRDGWLSSLASGAGAVWDATGGKLVDAAGKAIQMGADLAWQVLDHYVPSFANVIREIVRQGGIFNYVKNKVFDVARGIFRGVGADKGFLKVLFDKFTKLHESGAKIIEALKHNDCQPLLDAFHQLADMASELAGKAWDKIKEFFKPIGDFFSDIWNKYIAKAMDKVSDLAGEAWKGIKDFFQSIWDSTEPLRREVGAAWDWLKKKIGIGSGPEGENKDGILQWASKKIGEAWDWIKKEMEPVTKPMMALWDKIKAIIPLDKILHLRDTVHEWLGNLKKMTANLQKKEDVVENQDVLRKEILPAIKMRIAQLKGKVAEAGAWVMGQVTGVAESVTSFLSGLRSNSILSIVSGAFGWIESKVTDLAEWANTKVQGLFGFLGRGLDRLSGFVEPVYDTLEKLVSILGDIVGKLPDLVFGKFWNAIPQCIRDPIRDWIIENVLKQIPILSSLMEVKDSWAKVKAFAIDLLKTLFVKGDLAGAAFKVARFVLELAGVDIDLMLRVIGKAADRLDEIIMEPLKFLKNLGAAFWQGLQKFLDNIVKHLANGLIGWLVGPLNKLGITGLKDLSLGSILNLVLQVLGINEGKIRSKLEKAVGPTAFKILDHAWRLLKALWDGGPAALWEEIKSQLSDLKNMVIGGITQWITKEVIEAGIAYLIKLSNPVGAIIQALQAIYKVVKTIIEKANQIMQVVDGVLDSIGDIMSGAIDGAATLVEAALGRAVPVAIAFVANLLGIGDPAPTVSKIIKDVQDRVDKAMDWLIQKFKDLAMKAFGFLKRMAGKVAGLIFPPRKFTAGTDEHTIDAKEHGDDYDIVIHTKEVTIQELITKAKSQGLKEAGQLEQAYEAYAKLRVTSKDEKEMEKQGKEKVASFEKVANLIASIYPRIPSLAGTKVETKITYGPTDRQGGSLMVAHPLGPDNPGKGSAPSAADDFPPIWADLEKKRHGHRLYIKGHLLNNKLGGSGTLLENITPLTYSANKRHFDAAEHDLQEAVIKNDKMVHYEVHVNYPGSRRSVPDDVDEAEGWLASSLSTHWYELVPKADAPSQLEQQGNPHTDTIYNVPPYPQT